MNVRTRFAPSPTGSLHVGGVRTALFSWLYAKHHQGQFILRIEDTDKERSTQESVDTILAGMNWLGLHCDEGPFYQSARHDRYQQVAQALLDNDKAYRCTCSLARLDALRKEQLSRKEKPRYDGHCRDGEHNASEGPYVIRFKNPTDGVVSFRDEVYGEINVDNRELDDLILIRSDRHPTYNFAVVIDDLDMQITHVIRGDDHINNTPRQINLFNALNAPIPIFAHLPMILGEDGKRLSKRHGAVNVLEFRTLGILPQALLNYLVRLGWSYGDQEIFSLDEMIAQFNLENVSRGVSQFNYDKLYWLNQHYQKTDAPESVANALAWHLEQAHLDPNQGPKLSLLVQAQAERCQTLAEMVEKSRYFFTDQVEYDEEAVNKHLLPTTYEPLSALFERLQAIDDWSREALQACIHDLCAALNLSMGKIAQPLRIAVTGSSSSPSIDLTLALLGKKRTLSRLEAVLKNITTRV